MQRHVTLPRSDLVSFGSSQSWCASDATGASVRDLRSIPGSDESAHGCNQWGPAFSPSATVSVVDRRGAPDVALARHRRDVDVMPLDQWAGLFPRCAVRRPGWLADGLGNPSVERGAMEFGDFHPRIVATAEVDPAEVSVEPPLSLRRPVAVQDQGCARPSRA